MLNFLIESKQEIEKMRDTLLTLKENEPRPHIEHHDQTHSLEQDTLEYAIKNLEVCIEAEIENLPPPSDELREEEYKENGRLFDLCCGIREFQKIVLPVFYRNQEHPVATIVRKVVGQYWYLKENAWSLHSEHPNSWYADLEGDTAQGRHWLDMRLSPDSDYTQARRQVYNWRTRLVNTHLLLRYLRSGEIRESNLQRTCGWAAPLVFRYQPDLRVNNMAGGLKTSTLATRNRTWGHPKNKTALAKQRRNHAQFNWGIEQMRTKNGKVYGTRVQEWAKLIFCLEDNPNEWGARQDIKLSDWKKMELFKKNKYSCLKTFNFIRDEYTQPLFENQMFRLLGLRDMEMFSYRSWETQPHELQPLAYHHEGIY